LNFLRHTVPPLSIGPCATLFIYFSDLTLASFGSSASTGIAYEYPILTAPGIRFSIQGTCIRWAEISHFTEICRFEQYSIIRSPKYALTPTKSAVSIKYAKYIICQTANKVNLMYENTAVFIALFVQAEIMPILSPN
jgi:predicted metal-dependent RNase